MKNKIALALFLVFAFSSACFAQNVLITPKKVIYHRPKPTAEYKKSFVITYPQVRAATPALSRKIEDTISYKKALTITVKDEMDEYQWLETASYEVNYNKNGILDITLSAEGSAAYPSSFSKTLVVNLKTGSRVRPPDVFTNLAALAAKVRRAQLAEIKKARADYKKDPESADFDGSEYFDNAKFGIKELSDFSVSDKGVTFDYNYGFPHIVQALQPVGSFFYSWAQIKPFIKRGGLLARFVS